MEWKSVRIDVNKPIDWDEVLKNVEKRAKEQFGRSDIWTQDMQRAWKALVEYNRRVK